MKKYRKVVIAGVCLALAFCFGAALVGCGEETTVTEDTEATEPAQTEPSTETDKSGYNLIEDGTLTVISEAADDWMQYEEDGELAGFPVDMVHEIADRLGLNCTYLDAVAFDKLLDDIEAGDVADIAVSSISITDEREQQVDFTDPYEEVSKVIIVPQDSDLTSAEDLTGRPIGAQKGTTDEDWVKENYPDSDCVPYDSIVDGLESLSAGEIDAFVYEFAGESTDVFEENHTDYKVIDEVSDTDKYAIAVNKDNSALTEAINGVLADMESDGTMQKLKDKWIDYSLEASGVGGDADEGVVKADEESTDSEDESDK